MANILPSPPLFGLTANRVIIASGPATVVNSSFAISGTTFDLASAGTLGLGGTATNISLGSLKLTFVDGTSAPVSAAGAGALRYNNSTHQFEKSANGGGWSPVADLGNFTFSGYTISTSAQVAGSTGMILAPNVADGSGSIAVVINNTTSWTSGDFLQVQNAGSDRVTLSDVGGGLGAIFLGPKTSNDYIFGGANSIAFRTAGNDRFTIDSSGKTFLYGDTDGAAIGPLVIQASALGSIGTSVTLDAIAAGGHAFSFISTGPTALPGASCFAIFDGSTSAYRWILDSSGNTIFGTGGGCDTTTAPYFDANGRLTFPEATSGFLLPSIQTNLVGAGIGFQVVYGGGSVNFGDSYSAGHNGLGIMWVNTGVPAPFGTLGTSHGFVFFTDATGGTGPVVEIDGVGSNASTALLLKLGATLPGGTLALDVQDSGGGHLFQLDASGNIEVAGSAQFDSNVQIVSGGAIVTVPGGSLVIAPTSDTLTLGPTDARLTLSETSGVTLFENTGNGITLDSSQGTTITHGLGVSGGVDIGSNNSLSGQGAANTTALTLSPNVADGASSIALKINNGTTLSNATAKLLSIQNNGTEKAAFTSLGNLNLTPAASVGNISQGTTNTTALTIAPNVADGASSIALKVNSATTLSTAGSKLLSVQNNGTEKHALYSDGSSTIGYVAQNTAGSSADTINQTNTTYANVWPSWTFNAPVAKTYLVHVDLVSSCSSVTTVLNVGFQLLVNGTPVAFGGSTSWFLSITNNVGYFSISARIPCAMNAGNNTLQLQWKALGGTGTIINSGSAYRVFTVTG